MALTYVDITADTRTLSAVAVGTDYILADSLSAFDATHLEAALAATTLADYTMPNTGVTADEYFAPFMASLDDLSSRYQYARIKNNPVEAVQALENAEPVV